VKGRLPFVLALSFLLSLLAVWGAYITAEKSRGFVGPAVMASSGETLSYVSIHSPGWMVLNSSFNGAGELVVLDEFSGERVFSYNVSEHLNYPLVLPREGSYRIYAINGSLTFSGHYTGVYPTPRVQKVLYGSITVLALLLVLWRWRA